MSEPIELASDELSVVVLPDAGARVHSLHAFGHLLTRTPPDPATHVLNPFFWGGYHMVPWCNRVDPGPYSLLGQPFTVPANHTDGTALHGLAYASEWAVVGDGVFRVEGGGPGTPWPWAYSATVTYEAVGAVLTVAQELTNESDRTMPAGVGFHPWFRSPSTLRVPSSRVFPDNADTAVRPDEVHGEFDLRRPTAVARGVDATWVDLTEPAVELVWDDLGVALTMTADRPDVVAVVARPHEFDATAVEFQTHAPAGIRRLLSAEPHALHTLAPGESLHLRLALHVHLL